MEDYVEIIEEKVQVQPIYEMWNDGLKYQWMVHYPNTETFVPALEYNEPFEIDGVVHTPINGSFEVV